MRYLSNPFVLRIHWTEYESLYPVSNVSYLIRDILIWCSGSRFESLVSTLSTICRDSKLTLPTKPLHVPPQFTFKRFYFSSIQDTGLHSFLHAVQQDHTTAKKSIAGCICLKFWTKLSVESRLANINSVEDKFPPIRRY